MKLNLSDVSKSLSFLIVSSSLLSGGAYAQSSSARTDDGEFKVIEFHVHPPDVPLPLRSPDKTIAYMDEMNVEFAVLNGAPAYLEAWTKAHPDRFIPALQFPCLDGQIAITDDPAIQCFEGNKVWPDLGWLEGEIKSGRIKMLGEISTEYFGIFANDAKLDPYYELAVKYDIPVLIHTGLGPEGGPAYRYKRSANYRAATSNPIYIEDVMLRHKKLRMVVQHAGWPYISEMINVLYHHPGVYVDVAALQLTARKEYYYFLKRLVDAGYGERILYGSDFDWETKNGVEAILSADFLTDEQKEDILYNNARRFLRLDKSDKDQDQ
ncbi:amidohydrolase family protein [Ruegeria atlantica]|uniref:amidohydrolase family protein n=1 Tax=Ruegeria atlantica TaxID=81569 RepID=UPI0024955411|nr:amidohydrolase family protein [Ruegeria atlantica]